MRTKITATALALTVVLGMTSTVLASTAESTEKITQDSTEVSEGIRQGTTEVKYKVSEAYTVTIPAAVTLKATIQDDSVMGYAGTASVKADGVLIDEGSTLTIRMSSKNAGEETDDEHYTLNYGETNISKIAYTIKDGENGVKNGAAVLTVEPNDTVGKGAAKDDVTLSFEAPVTAVEAATLSGEHTDVLTFIVSVEKPANAVSTPDTL